MLRACLIVAAFGVPFASTSAQQTLLQFEGSAALDAYGWALAGGRDLNGDGVPDAAIGVPQDALTFDSATGRALVYSGATGTELFDLNGVASLDDFGASVAGLPDLTGDGVPEFFVGAPNADPGGVTAAGQARVFSGADGSMLHDLVGPAQGSFFGRSVAGVGDVDFDGTPDLLVGAQGFVTIFSGDTGDEWLTLTNTASNFGLSVADGGDLDGNGTRDVLVGAPSEGGGQVFAYDGHTGALLHTVSGGVSSLALQGRSILALGDITGDGNTDYAVGAPHHIGNGGRQGRLKLISGVDGSTVWSVDAADVTGFLFGDFAEKLDLLPDASGDGLPDLIASSPGSAKVALLASSDGATLEVITGSINDGFGEDATSLGDVDDDGVTDLLVGKGHHPRAVTLLSGASLEEIYEVDTNIQDFGDEFASVGDVDGDGVVDFIVGAERGFAEGPGTPGAVELRSGLDGTTLLTLHGLAPDDRFGFAVALLDDVSGDGLADVLVAAPRADPGGLSNAGRVQLVSGADGSEVYALEGGAANAALGTALTRLHDLDGDGVDDFAASQPGLGTVLVVSGASGATIHTLVLAAGSSGNVLASAGDLNGDGRDEILVGSPGAGNDFLFGFRGRVELFSGLSGASLLVINGASSTGEELGTSLAGGLDWNDDGVLDIFAGAAVGETEPFTDSGRVKIFSGATGALLDTLHGGTDRGRFGSALAVIGDADGDGVPELGVGAPGSDLSEASNPGEVFVFSGASHALIASFDGPAFYDRFGNSLASAGDSNGDGVGDLLAGLPGLPDGGNVQVGAARVLSVAGFPAGVTSFGVGCAGSGGVIPVAGTAGGAPSVGNASFAVNVGDAPASQPGFLIVGFSRDDWDGVPLPFALDGAGLPGCRLFVSGDKFLNIATDASGARTVAAPIPADLALVGGTVFVQWYVSDPAPGFKPGAMSQALELEIQAP